jgi:RNA polymerase sigma factor (sigma-70 family)
VARERQEFEPRAPHARRLKAVRCTWVEKVTDKQQLDRDFTELYKAHLRDVYSYSYYRIGNHHDAEDLTEQTFLQAYRHFERAQRESNGRPLRPWLIRIAHNLAANYYRDRSRRPVTHLDDAAVASGNPNRLKAWWIYRTLFSPDPLGERLTLMWHNHFATSNRKVQNLVLMREQNELLRTHCRASFSELLRTVVKQKNRKNASFPGRSP